MVTSTADACALLSVNDLLSVRISEHALEYASRVEDIDGETLILAAPMGASAALLAAGTRTVRMAWLCSRGHYEQTAELIEHITLPIKLWRVRPAGEAELEQRRRYVRVPAILPVTIDVGREQADVGGTTIDVAEGGMRLLCAPDSGITADSDVVIHLTVGDTDLAINANVLRCTPRAAGRSELVVSFPAEGSTSDVLRRFVFLAQLRERTLARGGDHR